LRPDLNTLHLSSVNSTAQVICDLHDIKGNPIEFSTREILRNATKLAADLNYKVMIGAELEWFCYDCDMSEILVNGSVP